jgi:hypothetical protein
VIVPLTITGTRSPVDQLLPGDVPRAWVVDVGRDGRGLGRRAQGPGHEARLVRRPLGRLVRRGPRQSRGRLVDLLDQILEVVLSQRDGRAIERVGADDVRAGGQVLVVDVADDLRMGEVEHLVGALEVAGMIGESVAAELLLGQLVALDERPHRAVEHENPLPD